jgi:hypothetical protein
MPNEKGKAYFLISDRNHILAYRRAVVCPFRGGIGEPANPVLYYQRWCSIA